MSIESLVIVEGQPDNNPKATVSNISCWNHVSFQCYYLKIIIIKILFSDSSLCWLVKKKRVNKHLIIDLLWMTIHLDTNNRSPIILELGLSQKQCAQGSSKTLKTGWPVLLGQIVFFIINNNDNNTIPPRHKWTV